MIELVHLDISIKISRMYIVISVYTQINKCNFGLSTNTWGFTQ